jgi:hypothetical protein
MVIHNLKSQQQQFKNRGSIIYNTRCHLHYHLKQHVLLMQTTKEKHSESTPLLKLESGELKKIWRRRGPIYMKGKGAFYTSLFL